MRIMLKILIFPIVLALSILVSVGRFLCAFSGVILSVAAMGLFLLALATAILLKDLSGAIPIAVGAYIISPYGIPLLAAFLVEMLDTVNETIQSI